MDKNPTLYSRRAATFRDMFEPKNVTIGDVNNRRRTELIERKSKKMYLGINNSSKPDRVREITNIYLQISNILERSEKYFTDSNTKISDVLGKIANDISNDAPTGCIKILNDVMLEIVEQSVKNVKKVHARERIIYKKAKDEINRAYVELSSKKPDADKIDTMMIQINAHYRSLRGTNYNVRSIQSDILNIFMHTNERITLIKKVNDIRKEGQDISAQSLFQAEEIASEYDKIKLQYRKLEDSISDGTVWSGTSFIFSKEEMDRENARRNKSQDFYVSPVHMPSYGTEYVRPEEQEEEEEEEEEETSKLATLIEQNKILVKEKDDAMNIVATALESAYGTVRIVFDKTVAKDLELCKGQLAIYLKQVEKLRAEQTELSKIKSKE